MLVPSAETDFVGNFRRLVVTVRHFRHLLLNDLKEEVLLSNSLAIVLNIVEVTFQGSRGITWHYEGGFPCRSAVCRCLRRLDSLQMKYDQLCSNVSPCEMQMVRHPVQ